MNATDTIVPLQDVIPTREIVLVVDITIITMYNLFALYVVQIKTPQIMNDYKPYMAHIIITFLVFEWDLFCCCFPFVIQTVDGHLVIISASIASILGLKVPLTLLVFLFGVGVMTTLHATMRSFFFRMNAIQPDHRKKPIRIVFYTVFLASIVVSIVGVGVVAFYAMESSKQNYGLQLSHGVILQTAYLVNVDRVLQASPIVIFVLSTTVLGTIAMIIYTYLCLYSERNLMSIKTKNFHKQLFWALFIQWLTTVIIGAVPGFVVIIIMLTSWKLANVFNLAILVCYTVCGATVPTVILATTRPYRKYVFKLLRQMKTTDINAQTRNATVTTVAESRSDPER